MLYQPTSLVDLHIGDASGTTWAPGHDIMPSVDPTLFPATLEESPDGVVVLVRQGVIRVGPVQPLSHTYGLLGDAVGEAQHALLALLHEVGYAELLDVALGFEAQLLLRLDLDPQPLAIEAVLVALLESAHRIETLPEIFIGAAPR